MNTPENYLVVYKVTGTTTQAFVTYANAQGYTERKSIRVPWETQLGMPPEKFVYLSALNEDDSSSITCEIYVDGKLYQQSTTSDANVIPSCSGWVGGL